MVAPHRLWPISGEFRDEAVERAFQDARFHETARQAHILFLASIVLNTLFLASDWRFYGDPHFYVAVPARGVVIAIAVIAFFGSRRCKRFSALQSWMSAWAWINALAVAALVTSQSQIALFVVVMLPSIYYLAVPTRFRWTAINGVGCGILMLLGYMLPGEPIAIGWGLALAMVMLNAALALVVTKSNRLRRMEWAAIQSERLAREKLAESQKTLESVFAAIPIPMVVGALSDGRVLRANDAARSFFHGHGPDAPLENIADIEMDPISRALFRRVLTRNHRLDGLEASISMSDGTKREVLLSAAMVEAGGVPSVVVSGIDISARRAAEARLERLATTDPLTGVFNRSHFFARAEAEIRRAARYRRPISVLMIDLDHFKRVNDAFGHAVGDAVLTEFAAHCARALRGDDVLARYGGEEFVALLPETDGQAAAKVAQRLREAASRIALPGAAARHMTVSIGVASVLAMETDIDPALRRADEALYEAKAGGRDQVVSCAIGLASETPSSTGGQAA